MCGVKLLATGVKKCGVLIGVLIGASLLLFTAIHMLEGDPIALRLKNPDPETVALERERLGLNAPLPVQYVKYVAEFVTGDWGRSLITQRPVAEDVFSRLTATLELTLAAMTLGLLYGIPIALFASSP